MHADVFSVKTLHLYILRQVLATLFMTVVVFIFVLLVGNALKQVLDLLVGGQANAGLVVKAVGLLMPYVGAYSLPMGMLTAALLVFGRFSADNELTAVRASGISLVSLVMPVLLLSLVLCGFSAYVNLELEPKTRAQFKQLIAQAKFDLSSVQLPEGRYIRDFPNVIFYVGKNNGGNLQDVTVMYLPDKTNVASTLVAKRGKVWMDDVTRELHIKLFEAQAMTILGDEKQILPTSAGDVEIRPGSLQEKLKSINKPPVDKMTLRQLREELREVESAFTLPPTNLPPAELAAAAKQMKRARNEATSPIRVQIQRRLASSFACFGFTLIGIPLGIRVHRRETNIGFLIALALVMIYYTLMLVGTGLDNHPRLYPEFLVWIPNFLFQGTGVFLLWRANRGV
jgi:lipopolysaccharide export system permease protein